MSEHFFFLSRIMWKIRIWKKINIPFTTRKLMAISESDVRAKIFYPGRSLCLRAVYQLSKFLYISFPNTIYYNNIVKLYSHVKNL